MNVDSLRSNANTNAQSAEIRIAKVFKTASSHLLNTFLLHLNISTFLSNFSFLLSWFFQQFGSIKYDRCNILHQNNISVTKGEGDKVRMLCDYVA